MLMTLFVTVCDFISWPVNSRFLSSLVNDLALHWYVAILSISVLPCSVFNTSRHVFKDHRRYYCIILTTMDFFM